MKGIEEDPESLQFDFDPNAPHGSLLLLFSSDLLLFDPKLLLSPQTDMFACITTADNHAKLRHYLEFIVNHQGKGFTQFLMSYSLAALDRPNKLSNHSENFSQPEHSILKRK